MAKAGSSPLAIMATAGHRSFARTRRYLHLAGQTFKDDADALERRLLGEPSTEPSTDPGAPENILGELSDAAMRPQTSAS